MRTSVESVQTAARQIAPVVVAALEMRRTTSDLAVMKYAEVIVYYMCRKMEHFVTPKISRQASLIALEQGVDLSRLSWAQQSKIDPKRQTFHFDHLVPVAAMRDALLKLNPPNETEVAAILGLADVAWILKRENRALDEKGYKSKRDNWRDCYREVGIDLD